MSKLIVPSFTSIQYGCETYIGLSMKHLTDLRCQLNDDSDLAKLLDVYIKALTDVVS